MGLTDWVERGGGGREWGLLVDAVCFGRGRVAVDVGEALSRGGSEVVLEASGVLGGHEGAVDVSGGASAHDGAVDELPCLRWFDDVVEVTSFECANSSHTGNVVGGEGARDVPDVDSRRKLVHCDEGDHVTILSGDKELWSQLLGSHCVGVVDVSDLVL